MKITYAADVDMLYIDLKDEPSVDSDEVAPGIVLDFGSGGEVVGIEISNASEAATLSQLNLTTFPALTAHGES